MSNTSYDEITSLSLLGQLKFGLLVNVLLHHFFLFWIECFLKIFVHQLQMVLQKPDKTEVRHTTNQYITLERFCNAQKLEGSVDLTIPDNGVIHYTFIPTGNCVNYRLYVSFIAMNVL